MTSNLGFALGAADYFTKPIDWHARRLLGQTPRAHGHSVLVVEDDPNDPRAVRPHPGEGRLGSQRGRQRPVGLEQVRAAFPSLILFDLMMPEMDGFGFMEGLRQQPDCRHVPVIVVTAKDFTEEDRRRLNGEVSRILQKGSFTPENLLAEVRGLVSHHTEFTI